MSIESASLDLEPLSGLDVKATARGRLETSGRLEEIWLDAGVYSAASDLAGRSVRLLDACMPTLARFVSILLVIAALVAAAVFYLGNFVEPWPREITIRVPPSRLEPRPVPRPPAPTPPPAAVEGPGDGSQTGTAAQ
jgi:hypothetical protein